MHKNKIIFINILFLFLGLFWIYRCNIWTDENWYYNGAVLFSKGYLPYIDFFYHRLPLHIEFYGILFKIFNSSFIFGRIISLGLFIILINLTAYIIYQMYGNTKLVLLTYIAYLNPLCLYGYLTNSTYSLNALLIIITISLFYWRWRLEHKIFFFIIFNFLILSNRYIIDYQTVFLSLIIIGLIYKFWNNHKILLYIISSTIIGILFIAKYFIIYGDTNIVYDTIVYNFSLKNILVTNGVNLPSGVVENIVQFARIRFAEFDSYYPFNIMAILAIFFIVHSFVKKRKFELIHYYIIAILLFNILFYYATIDDWPVGKLYIYPLLIILSIIFVNKITKTFKIKFSFYFFILLFLTQGLSVGRNFITTNYNQSDIYELNKVSKRIDKYADEGLMLTFTPLLSNSGIITEPLLNMEMFSFRPDLNSSEAKKIRVLNVDLLLEKISVGTYSIIVLSDERFFNGRSVAKTITPYKEEIINTIMKKYELKEIVNSGNFRSSFQIYGKK